MIDKLNVLIIGNGHYSTGCTVLEGVKETDKDYGVILPAILELKKQGYINNISLAARNGKKFVRLKEKISTLHKEFGWSEDIKLFPEKEETKVDAYKDALKNLEKPSAVIIATPDHLHKKMILDSIDQGNHFLVVKPAVKNIKELEEVIVAQEKARVLGMVEYHKIFDEANLLLKLDYENGKYGDILHIYSKLTQRRDMLEIFKEWINEDNNVNHYLNSHYIHIVGFATGAVPINVRATSHYGIAKNKYKINTPDLIITEVLWKAKNNTYFTSHHIGGWMDPSESSSMSDQQIHIIGTEGCISSNQKERGLEKITIKKGLQTMNPYFFNIHKGLDGNADLEGKYGFKSIKTFIKTALEVENGADLHKFDSMLPTIKESYKVTAILEAADISRKNNSCIVELDKMLHRA